MKVRFVLLSLPVLVLILSVGCSFASSEGGGTWTSTLLTWRVINTVALLAILIYVLKKPMANFFSERKIQIQRDLEDSKEQLARAERIIAEYQQKIAGMEKELDKMRAELAKSAEAESRKVIAGAERMAEAMVDSARLTADQEVRKAKVALKSEAVSLAVELAEALVRERIDDDDRKRLVEDYLGKVGGMK